MRSSYNEPYFDYNKDTGETTCILTDGYNSFYGIAICNENDKDMQSEMTGSQIALWRATIKYLKHIKDNEIQPKLKALYQLYYSMNTSKKFNPKSYENIMLWRQIRNYENDLITINEQLATIKQELKDYIAQKDEFYKKIRKHRESEKKDKTN